MTVELINIKTEDADMNCFRDTIINRIKKLDHLIEAKEKSLSKAPDGNLRTTSCRGTAAYYQVCNGSRKHISLQLRSLITSLAQKDYDKQIITLATEEITLLQTLLEHYPATSVEELFQTLSPARQPLVHPILRTDEDFLNEWISEPFAQKTFDSSATFFRTLKGDKVRSKSEKIIADNYYYRNIPYKYEKKLTLADGKILHPDFTLMNMRTRTEIYHEHLGKMDDPGYVMDQTERLDIYERNGIYLGDRLFITHETLDEPLNMDVLNNIIDRFSR